jgi:hypothetical protein
MSKEVEAKQNDSFGSTRLDLSENAREANVCPLRAGDHGVHHVALSRLDVALAFSVVVHIHRNTAPANQHRPPAKGVPSLH